MTTKTITICGREVTLAYCNAAITIAEEPGKMPRKMKKAYRSTHRRETKWKRKVENYIKRKTYHARQATIEVTGNDGQTVSAEVRFDRLDRECDMHGNQTFRMSGKSITVTHTPENLNQTSS